MKLCKIFPYKVYGCKNYDLVAKNLFLQHIHKCNIMRNITFSCLLLISFLFSACGNQTLQTYNDTIVTSYNELNNITKDLTPKIGTYAGKPEKLAEFKKTLEGYRKKLLEARKPVENLVPIKDADFRKNCLDLFDDYESLLLTLNLKADKFTALPTPENDVTGIIFERLKSIEESNKVLLESQYRFAEQNNAHLR